MNYQQSAETSGGPLAGLRVLDLTSVVLGPIATQYLGDYGADVIKVESPEGDMMRGNGTSLRPGMSSIFLAVNRNKRSICLDLKSVEAVEVIHKLLPTVDVFIHNMRPRAMEKLGLAYDVVSKICPSIVYCAAPAFGQDGPHRDKPAFDDVIQAASGLAMLNGLGRDKPSYVPSLIADKVAGMNVLNAVLAAVVHQARHGRGQYVEVPMFESFVQFMLAEHLGGMTFNPQQGPAGYHRLLEGGREPVRTKDGWMTLLPYTAKHWLAFLTEVGRQDVLANVEVGDRKVRNENIAALYSEIRDVTPTKTTAEWMTVCEKLDIPATPMYSLEELPEHPHLKAVGMLVDDQHPTEGAIRYVRPAARFSATPASVRVHAPLQGQHTHEVLIEAGYDEKTIASLAAKGVLGTAVKPAVEVT